jgi:hypothetical protein
MRPASVVLTLLLSAAACGGGDDPAGTSCSVSAVAVSPAAVTLDEGATRQLSATLTSRDCTTDPGITWSSSNEAVATVSASGLLTAVAPGTTGIRASSGGQQSPTVSVTVSPLPVAEVEVTLAAQGRLVGQTSTATAVVKAAGDRVLTGRTIVWSSSDPSVASIDPATGVITANALGATTIRATVGGVTDDTRFYVLAAESSRFAFAWADQPSVALNTPYAPDVDYVLNATGGTVRVTRTGVGAYTVSFQHLGKETGGLGARRENVFVNAYGLTPARCVVLGWSDDADNGAVATVQCRTLAGAPADSRFVVALIGANVLSGSHGFAWSTSEAGGAVSSSYAFSSAAGAITNQRQSAGLYAMQFPLPALSRSTVLVSAYDADRYCHPTIWNEQVGSFSVRCVQPGGTTPGDGRFTALMASAGRAGQRWGFVWNDRTDAPVGVPYQPNPLYREQSNGSATSVVRLGVGRYEVRLPGLGVPTFKETVLVSAYGPDAPGPCQVESWDPSGTELRVQVRCWNAGTGAADDARFSLMVLS